MFHENDLIRTTTLDFLYTTHLKNMGKPSFHMYQRITKMHVAEFHRTCESGICYYIHD